MYSVSLELYDQHGFFMGTRTTDVPGNSRLAVIRYLQKTYDERVLGEAPAYIRAVIQGQNEPFILEVPYDR